MTFLLAKAASIYRNRQNFKWPKNAENIQKSNTSFSKVLSLKEIVDKKLYEMSCDKLCWEQHSTVHEATDSDLKGHSTGKTCVTV